jgi:hypothetical protein
MMRQFPAITFGIRKTPLTLNRDFSGMLAINKRQFRRIKESLLSEHDALENSTLKWALLELMMSRSQDLFFGLWVFQAMEATDQEIKDVLKDEASPF